MKTVKVGLMPGFRSAAEDIDAYLIDVEETDIVKIHNNISCAIDNLALERGCFILSSPFKCDYTDIYMERGVDNLVVYIPESAPVVAIIELINYCNYVGQPLTLMHETQDGETFTRQEVYVEI